MKVLLLFILLACLGGCLPPPEPPRQTAFPLTVVDKSEYQCIYQDAEGYPIYVDIDYGDTCNLGDQVNINPAQ